jgi:polyhydroxyalkanoate synthesis regulator phasin
MPVQGRTVLDCECTIRGLLLGENLIEQSEQGAAMALDPHYTRMLERVRDWLVEAEHSTETRLATLFDQAQAKATELGELSREEAARISDWVQKDLEEAGEWSEETGRELKEWLHDRGIAVEAQLLNLFEKVVDRSRVELARFGKKPN